MARVFWFRRDLRLQDNIALNAAIHGATQDGDAQVCGLYVVNTDDFHALSGIRQWSLYESLDSLGASMDRKLTIQPWMARLKDNLCRRGDFDDSARGKAG